MPGERRAPPRHSAKGHSKAGARDRARTGDPHVGKAPGRQEGARGCVSGLASPCRSRHRAAPGTARRPSTAPAGGERWRRSRLRQPARLCQLIAQVRVPTGLSGVARASQGALRSERARIRRTCSAPVGGGPIDVRQCHQLRTHVRRDAHGRPASSTSCRAAQLHSHRVGRARRPRDCPGCPLRLDHEARDPGIASMKLGTSQRVVRGAPDRQREVHAECNNAPAMGDRGMSHRG